MLNKRVPGYITVEATLLVPCLVMIIVLPIYWTFYMYNKCVLYQDCYLAALRGSQLQGEEINEIENSVRSEAERLLDNQLHKYQIEPCILIDNNIVCVSAETKMNIIASQVMQIEHASLSSLREAKCKMINPVSLLRKVY